jgi:Transcriptional regulators
MTYSSGSQSHLAYLALEQRIVTHRLAPGALVTEKQLIELSGHGRTPVREAIQKLAWQGLVLVRPRVGLQIAEIHPDDHRQIMAVRLRLEPLAASLVATHANKTQRTALVECARAMTTAATNGSYETFLAADKRFDEIVEAACPNAFLISALTPLQAHSRRLWYASATADKMDRSVSLHVAVIRAIQQGDAAEAEAAMRRLLEALTEG